MRSADPTFDDSVNKQTGKSRTNPAIVHVPGSIALQDFAVTSVPQQQHLLHDAASTTHHVSDHEKVSSPLEVAARKRPRMLHHPSSIAGRASFIDKDEPVPTAVTPPATPPSPPSSQCLAKAGPVSWSDLPSKRQLCILTMARLSEPLTQTSLQAYMFYQLKYFNPSLSSSTISAQAGMLQASFTAAQFVTAILWGRMADADWGGRKRVLLIGLFGTAVSCVGFGFSRSFWQAMVCRTLGGALNGNIGVMRTMISEIIKEKRFQSRAFLLLPMCFNIGIIVGPILGGLLSDPVESYPSVFGDNSLFGGKNGVWWLNHWPYALPNLMSAVFLLCSAIAVVLGLEETLESIRDRPDIGLRIAQSIPRVFCTLFHRNVHQYAAVNLEDNADSPISGSPFDNYELESRLPKLSAISQRPKRKARLPLSRIWTRNVLCTLLCHFLLALHLGTFNNLWFVHLSAPRFDPENPQPPSHTHQSFPLKFTGGLGMPPRSVGFAMALLGVIGISLQLLIYPTVNARLGTLRSFRYSLCLFPLAYTIAPYLSIVPSSAPPPSQVSGFLIWFSLSLVLFVQVVGRTFALPATIILVNNCSPHPSVLGTIHGIAQSVSSASRTIGPVLGGWGFGKGLESGVVGSVWWGMACVASIGWVVSSLVREGTGHEIILEGEEDEEEE